MAVVRKKCWPEYFEAIQLGKKKYDLRLNDFEIKEGDTLRLEEWDPVTKDYTGRTIEKKVTYVGQFDINNLFGQSKEEIETHGLMVLSLE